MPWLKCCLISGLLLAGCTRTQVPQPDTIVVALSAQPLTLDPRLATDATGMRIGNLIFSSLVHIGPNLEVVGDAAEKWAYQNHLYTFQLRPDLRFHNGRAVNRKDLEFSFDQYRNGGPFASNLSVIKSVTVTDSPTPPAHLVVQIEVKNYSDKFLSSDLPIVKILPSLEVGVDFGNALIGSGPYRFIKKSPDQIELEAVHAATKHLIFKVIRDDYTRFQKMLNGEIDIIQQELTPDKVPYFEKSPARFHLYFYPGLSMTYLLINHRDPLLGKLTVRQALARTINREEIIRYKLYGQAIEATSLLTPNNRYFEPDLRNLHVEPSLAAKAIADLGLAGHTLTLKTSNSPQVVENAKVLANQMRRSGLNIQIQSYEWGTFYADIKRGGFQMATMRWVGTVDPDIYRMAFHSKETPPGRNRGAYLNPQLDQLLDEGTNTENMILRKKIFARVQKIVQDDLAIIPLWYDRQIAVSKASVKDYVPDQSGEYYPLVQAHKDGP